MAKYSLLDLPDLALHNIFNFIVSPFDFLNFGSTCSRLHEISLSHSMWWKISMTWLTGLWPFINYTSSHENPRSWLLTLLSHITVMPRSTMLECEFENGEIWSRVDTRKFRCLLGMLEIAYADQEKDHHPGVLYERWLYDIGLYRRNNLMEDFSSENLNLSKDQILKLASLGQAKERDLRARKQPNIDPKYYIKKIAVAQNDWIEELFPCGPHGSICPLLTCPFQNAFTTEFSGLPGLVMCLSLVLERYFIYVTKTATVSMGDIAYKISSACDGFQKCMMQHLPTMKQLWGSYCLTPALHNLATEDNFDLTLWQETLNALTIPLQCKDILKDIFDLVEKHGGIDIVVDSVRLHWRKLLIEEINAVLLCSDSHSGIITRVNLTDSDLIGGDNRRQEMSSAAFISSSSVLVTWHLIGRLRF